MITIIDNEDEASVDETSGDEASGDGTVTTPKPYDPPKNSALCNKPTNKPLGCPCFFGQSCKSGNCDTNYNLCIKRNSNKDTTNNAPDAPNTITKQQREMIKRERDKSDCINDGNSWDGANCIKKN